MVNNHVKKQIQAKQIINSQIKLSISTGGNLAVNCIVAAKTLCTSLKPVMRCAHFGQIHFCIIVMIYIFNKLIVSAKVCNSLTGIILGKKICFRNRKGAFPWIIGYINSSKNTLFFCFGVPSLQITVTKQESRKCLATMHLRTGINLQRRGTSCSSAQPMQESEGE